MVMVVNSQQGDASTAGLIDEVGAATALLGTGIDSPPGELLFSMQVRAVGATNSQTTTIQTDPNENGLFETTVNNAVPLPFVVPFAQITYNSLDLTINSVINVNGEPVR